MEHTSKTVYRQMMQQLCVTYEKYMHKNEKRN